MISYIINRHNGDIFVIEQGTDECASIWDWQPLLGVKGPLDRGSLPKNAEDVPGEFDRSPNRIEEIEKQLHWHDFNKLVLPEKGMPCTIGIGSDSYGATIVAVTRKTVIVQEDTEKLVGGSTMSEHQEYEYERNPHGRIERFYLNSRGQWVNGPSRLHVGSRRSYRDPSF